MWYTRDEHHGNERLKVMGLQCLVNFHVNTPTVAFHEAILPCLNQLGQSAATGVRRSVGARNTRVSELFRSASNMESVLQCFKHGVVVLSCAVVGLPIAASASRLTLPCNTRVRRVNI